MVLPALALLLLGLALPALAAAAGARDLFIRSAAIGSGWQPSGKVADLPRTSGVQGSPQLSSAGVAGVAGRSYHHGRGISRRQMSVTITVFTDAAGAGARIDDLIRKKGHQGISRPLDLGATVGERSVGDQGMFGERRNGRDVEYRFKTACLMAGTRVVCMTLSNRRGHGRPSTTVVRRAARAEAAKLAATP